MGLEVDLPSGCIRIVLHIERRGIFYNGRLKMCSVVHKYSAHVIYNIEKTLINMGPTKLVSVSVLFNRFAQFDHFLGVGVIGRGGQQYLIDLTELTIFQGSREQVRWEQGN